MKPYILTLSVIMAFLSAPAWATYTVAKVVDGDTVDVSDGTVKFRIRIAGMDAPEHDQAFGQNAKAELIDLVGGKEITIKPIGEGIDRYGRSLGQIFVGGQDVSLLMIQKGFAYYYRPTCEDYPLGAKKFNYDPRAYVSAEATAKQSKLNLWSVDRGELPCAFRKSHKW
jgi:micrococcal nuclease